MVFGFVGHFLDKFGDALRPLKAMDTKPIINRLTHPIHVKKLMKAREVAVLYIGDGKNILIIGGYKFSNIVFIPELVRGWTIMKDSDFSFDGKAAYLVDKSLGYTLQISEHTLNFDPEKEIESNPELRKTLGLPDKVVAVQSDTMGQIAASKWNQGFEESRGQVLIFIFGMLTMFALVFIVTIMIALIIFLIAVFS